MSPRPFGRLVTLLRQEPDVKPSHHENEGKLTMQHNLVPTDGMSREVAGCRGSVL
jgi:hypothetical protein